MVGLGNPGGEYRGTRHNAGWLVLDELEGRGRFGRERREGPAKVREGAIDGYELVTARPQTFMNVSGRAAMHLTRRFGVPAEDLIVVHDEVDLPLGRIRIKRGGGAAGNKGVLSIADSLRTQEFMRVRVGVSRPPDRDQMVDYVLDRFHPQERERLQAVLARAADAVMSLVRDGLEKTMTEYNRAPDS